MTVVKHRVRADPGASVNNATTPSEPAGDPQARARRRFYISLRLPELQESIERLAGEREALSADLERRRSETGAGVKALRQRRSYVATRLDILRAERKELAEERQLINRDEGDRRHK